MIGFNGGLFGKLKTTAAGLSIPGVWTLREQIEAKRSLTWAGSPLLLDIFLGSTAAYSLRNLRTAYAASPVVRVRRSTDSTERDFIADQVIDTTSNGMLAWVKETSATANGFVRTWYDQSGSNNNAEQTDTTLQPRIVTSGVLETDSGKPSILFGQANGVCLLPPSVGGIGANCAFFTVTKSTNAASTWSWILGERVGGGTMIIGKREGTSTLHIVGFGGGAGDVATATISSPAISYWQQGSGISRYMINNTGGSLPGGSNTASDFRIGNRASNLNEVWVGYISEIIYFSTSQITRNASISFSMNKYYNYYAGISATGGNTTEDKIINSILYRVHTFTTVGVSSFLVSNVGSVEYLVIAGGGGGGSGYQGGGGGAGGLLTGSLAITSGSYNITVGDGGTSNNNGGNSIFSSITATGGGRGASEFSGYGAAAAGGSGGGGGHGTGVYTGGAGTAGPPVQGFAGGAGTVTNFSSGGGGGASGTGETADGDEVGGAVGGLGLALDFNGVITTYSTGGKGSRRNDNTTGVAGASNTGNGGGGSSNSASGTATGAKGGSGIVIIRYPI